MQALLSPVEGLSATTRCSLWFFWTSKFEERARQIDLVTHKEFVWTRSKAPLNRYPRVPLSSRRVPDFRWNFITSPDYRMSPLRSHGLHLALIVSSCIEMTQLDTNLELEWKVLNFNFERNWNHKWNAKESPHSEEEIQSLDIVATALEYPITSRKFNNLPCKVYLFATYFDHH